MSSIAESAGHEPDVPAVRYAERLSILADGWGTVIVMAQGMREKLGEDCRDRGSFSSALFFLASEGSRHSLFFLLRATARSSWRQGRI